MHKHFRESSRNIPARNGPGRAAKTTGRAGPVLVVARTGRAGPGGRRAGPKNFGPFSALDADTRCSNTASVCCSSVKCHVHYVVGTVPRS
jgi:hypothetical protein